MKVLDASRAKDCPEIIRKEVCIHKVLSHANIVRFFGHRHEGHTRYLFLEYCSGGELFDRIGERWAGTFGLGARHYTGCVHTHSHRTDKHDRHTYTVDRHTHTPTDLYCLHSKSPRITLCKCAQ